MKEIEVIHQKSEQQKKQGNYEKRYRKQIKEKLQKIKKQYKGVFS